jgi:hypothetical protein
LAETTTKANESHPSSLLAGWSRISIISVLLLIPCFWHRHLEAGDLGSHVYNAWLVQLIEQGKAPGLWLSHQWNNILFDEVLSGIGTWLGFGAAERIAVVCTVLVFFWGAFAFVHALTGRAPWLLTPLLAAFAYGWTFEKGLFNYYVSIGFAFWGLAALLSGRAWARGTLILLVPLTLLAHPLGVAWLLGGGVFLGIAWLLSERRRWTLLPVAALMFWAVHFYIAKHYVSEAPLHSVALYNGADQFLLTGKYALVALALILFGLSVLATDILRRRREAGWLSCYELPATLYLTVEAGVLLLPTVIFLPHYGAPISYLADRLTLISAVLLVCLLGVALPRSWHIYGSGLVAALFFAFLFHDTAQLSGMEDQVEALVREIPPGTRVLATFHEPLRNRISAKHIVDRPCIGRCFLYGNYETASTQFRVRGAPGNRFVLTSYERGGEVDRGEYVVEAEDLPVVQIEPCTNGSDQLCMRSLHAGEFNGIH